MVTSQKMKPPCKRHSWMVSRRQPIGIGDLRLLNKPWLDIDVDDRNSVISSWREKIVGEMEAYF